MAIAKSLILILLFCLTAHGSSGSSGPKKEREITEEEQLCADTMHMCHEHYAPHVRGDIAKPFTPHELEEMCSHHNFLMCMEEVKGNCTEVQLLKIESVMEGEEYVCREDSIRDYSKGSWEKLGTHEMMMENDLCTDQFLMGAIEHLREYMHLDAKERPEEVDEKTELLEDIKSERDDCCGHFYAYMKCVESAVSRQADEDLAHWQYDVLSKFYTPEYETCQCKIGKGMTMIFRNAMIIVAALLGFIFGLASYCGIIDCCGMKVKLCRRRCRQMCYCCYDFEEDDEYFERKYEAKLNAIYGEDNEAYDRKSFNA